MRRPYAGNRLRFWQSRSWRLFGRCAAILFLCTTMRSHGAPLPSSTHNAQRLRVLFIGNSLTYANELPAMIQALAAAGGHKLDYKMVAYPDYSLLDHWERGDARRAIAADRWHVVVLQQGPSASEEGRAVLLKYARLFADEIRRAGAKPALYMVWPASSRRDDFDRAGESYALAAREVDGLLMPVGEAWREAQRRDPKLKLFAPDGLHPSLAGSYLGALVFYQQLYEQTPVGLPARLNLRAPANAQVSLSPEQAALLQTAAAETNARFARQE